MLVHHHVLIRDRATKWSTAVPARLNVATQSSAVVLSAIQRFESSNVRESPGRLHGSLEVGACSTALDLGEAGETCSVHRVARLMRENNLRALNDYRIRRWSVGTLPS